MRISDWSSDVCSSDLVLRKALEANLPVVLVVNKVDRADARIAEVVHEVEELFLDLDADENQIDFPIVYAVSREGKASMERPADGAGLPDGATLAPLLDLLVERIPAPSYDPEAPLQALVTNLDSSPYLELGRASCRERGCQYVEISVVVVTLKKKKK